MGNFRTTEISDPNFEHTHLRFITVKSQNLKGRGDICVYVPPIDNAKNLPVAILLHGVYGSAWIWSQKGGAHITAQQLIENQSIEPIILAMPSDGLWGDGSAYLPHSSTNFEQWIVDDVKNAIVELIPQASDNSTFFISGLSMGGFGALRLGSKYNQLFKGISAHSSITNLQQMEKFVEEPLQTYKQEAAVDEDVFETVLKNKDQLPPLRFDCGRDDLLIEENRKLHQALTSAGIDHEYNEFPGSHEWSYWIEHLQDSLLFFNRLLKTNT